MWGSGRGTFGRHLCRPQRKSTDGHASQILVDVPTTFDALRANSLWVLLAPRSTNLLAHSGCYLALLAARSTFYLTLHCTSLWVLQVRDPTWDAPCQMIIPAGTPAALYLARLQVVQGDGGLAAWNTIERYLTLEELDDFYEPPQLRVRVLDKDPGEASDDLIGASELTLEELSGTV